jgi:hypothetical protein
LKQQDSEGYTRRLGASGLDFETEDFLIFDSAET